MGLNFDWLGSFVFLKIYTLLSFIVNFFISVICYFGKLGKKSTLDTWDAYKSPLTLSSWAHSLWWILFLIEACYTIYLFVPFRKVEKKEIVKSFGVWLPLSWNFLTAWTVVFSFQLIPLSLLFIAGHWLFIFVSYNNINQTYENKLDVLVYGVTDPRTGEKIPLKKREKFATMFEYCISYLPTSLQLGWVTLITVVNLTAASAYEQHQLYASLQVCLLFLISLIVFAVAVQRLDPLLCCSVCWGLLSITKSKSYISTSAVVLAAVLAIISLLISGYLLVRNCETRKIHEQQRLLKDEEWG